MNEHVTSVSRAPYYHLKNTHCLEAFLPQEGLFLIVHAFNRLQQIQNGPTRRVPNPGQYDYITPIIHNLNWLPVSVFTSRFC